MRISLLMLFFQYSDPALATEKAFVFCDGKSAVPFYSRPGALSPSGTLSCDQQVFVIGKESAYTLVEYVSGQQGYVISHFIRPQIMPAMPPLSLGSSSTLVANKPTHSEKTSPLPVYRQPKPNYVHSGKPGGGFWKKFGKGLYIGTMAAGAFAQAYTAYEVQQPTYPQSGNSYTTANTYTPLATQEAQSQSHSGSSSSTNNMTYFHFQNGKTGTAQRLGNFTYYSLPSGTGTAQKIGNFTYYDFSNGWRGTAQKIGNFTYFDSSDGVNGTAQKIGRFTYFDFSDGKGGTAQTIGNTTYFDLK